MASQLAWLDFDAEQQRRTREMLRLFEEKESRDELGIGQVRDAFSDLLFPGMSVLLTRARYFLIVPWCAEIARSTSHYKRGRQTLEDVERRALLALVEDAPHEPGIIGARAGAAVKNLPSVLYNQALERYGIARVGADDGTRLEEDLGEEVTHRGPNRWAPSVPPAPAGFPAEMAGGLQLDLDEARWLSEQMTTACPGTYLTHVLESDVPLDGVEWAWTHPAASTAPSQVREILGDAELFSLAMHGAALLYNLLIAEFYTAEGLTSVVDPVERYRGRLTEWYRETHEHREMAIWDIDAMWARVLQQNPRIGGNVRARNFITTWLTAVVRGDVDGVADDADLRTLIRQRETSIKGPQSRLRNEKLLRTWAGASGSRRLEFRWGNVRTLLSDIHVGLGVSRAGA